MNIAELNNFICKGGERVSEGGLRGKGRGRED